MKGKGRPGANTEEATQHLRTKSLGPMFWATGPIPVYETGKEITN